MKKWLIDVDENKIIKRATFWNLISSLLNSLMTAILLFFITRINGIDKAGMFSVASAFAYQCLSLGHFGVRYYHASDVKNDYSYKDYFSLRIISGILMYLLLIYYAFAQGYTLEKSLIVLTFGIFKSIDTFEDLIHGEFQRKNRLDIGSILQSVRYIISIVLFVILLYITKDFTISCSIVIIVTIVLLYLLNEPIIKELIKKKGTFNSKKTITLFLACLPICLGNVINIYIVNCPKYAIDRMLTDRIQTFFGILAMPVFMINLLSAVVFRPYVKSLGDAFQTQRYKDFFKIVLRQVVIVLGLTILAIAFGYIIGLTLMEIIFGVKLHKYMLAFILLLMGGGLNSLAAYFAVVLTTARGQNKLFIGYAITFIAALLIANPLVKNYGITGGAYLYIILNLITVIIFTFFIFMKYSEDKKRRKKHG